jgi:hypothetical protein
MSLSYKGGTRQKAVNRLPMCNAGNTRCSHLSGSRDIPDAAGPRGRQSACSGSHSCRTRPQYSCQHCLLYWPRRCLVTAPWRSEAQRTHVGAADVVCHALECVLRGVSLLRRVRACAAHEVQRRRAARRFAISIHAYAAAHDAIRLGDLAAVRPAHVSGECVAAVQLAAHVTALSPYRIISASMLPSAAT